MIIRIDEHLCLREINIADTQSIFQIIDAYRDELREWLTFIDSTISDMDTLNYIKSVSPYNSDGDKVYTILYNEKIVGLIDIENIHICNNKAEIGYWLSPEYQGKGIMRKSVMSLMHYAFTHLEFNRIQIKCAVANHKSNNIPLKIGFKHEGIEREGELLSSGKYTDLNVYSMLKHEFITIPTS